VNDSDQRKQPATVEEAARLVLEWLSPDDRAQFVAAMEKDDLTSLHFGLALAVRDRLGLWGTNEKLLMDCAQARYGDDGPSYIHAAEASSTIIRRVWKLAREEK
jgi:hypothetical protein